MDVETEVVCEAVMADCRCQQDAQVPHTLHICACLGQWTGTEPDCHAVSLPLLDVGPWPTPEEAPR